MRLIVYFPVSGNVNVRIHTVSDGSIIDPDHLSTGHEIQAYSHESSYGANHPLICANETDFYLVDYFYLLLIFRFVHIMRLI